jgi:hypothetical protein
MHLSRIMTSFYSVSGRSASVVVLCGLGFANIVDAGDKATNKHNSHNKHAYEHLGINRGACAEFWPSRIARESFPQMSGLTPGPARDAGGCPVHGRGMIGV